MRCNESNSYLRPSRVVRPTSAFAALVLLLQAPAPAETRIMLPQIFKDGVILQHTQPVVFGYAAASEKVTVTITPRGGGAVSFPAVADAATGRWSVLVAPPKEDPLGEVTVTVSATASTTPSITLQHVSFGELLPPLPLPLHTLLFCCVLPWTVTSRSRTCQGGSGTCHGAQGRPGRGQG